MLPGEENRILSVAGMMKQWLEGIIFQEGPRRKFLVTVPVGKFRHVTPSMYSVHLWSTSYFSVTLV